MTEIVMLSPTRCRGIGSRMITAVF